MNTDEYMSLEELKQKPLGTYQYTNPFSPQTLDNFIIELQPDSNSIYFHPKPSKPYSIRI